MINLYFQKALHTQVKKTVIKFIQKTWPQRCGALKATAPVTRSIWSLETFKVCWSLSSPQSRRPFGGGAIHIKRDRRSKCCGRVLGSVNFSDCHSWSWHRGEVERKVASFIGLPPRSRGSPTTMQKWNWSLVHARKSRKEGMTRLSILALTQCHQRWRMSSHWEYQLCSLVLLVRFLRIVEVHPIEEKPDHVWFLGCAWVC